MIRPSNKVCKHFNIRTFHKEKFGTMHLFNDRQAYAAVHEASMLLTWLRV